MSFDLMADFVRANGWKADYSGEEFLVYKKDGMVYWVGFDKNGRLYFETDSWRREKLDGRSWYTPEEIKAGLRDKKKE